MTTAAPRRSLRARRALPAGVLALTLAVTGILGTVPAAFGADDDQPAPSVVEEPATGQDASADSRDGGAESTEPDDGVPDAAGDEAAAADDGESPTDGEASDEDAPADETPGEAARDDGAAPDPAPGTDPAGRPGDGAEADDPATDTAPEGRTTARTAEPAGAAPAAVEAADADGLIVEPLPETFTTVDHDGWTSATAPARLAAFQIRYRAADGVAPRWYYTLPGAAEKQITTAPIATPTHQRWYDQPVDADGYVTSTFWLSYQWSTLNTRQGAAVRVVVGDGTTSEESSTTWSLDLDAITVQPQDLTVQAGETATFSAGLAGAPEPEVTWQTSTDDGATWGDADAEATVAVVDNPASVINGTTPVGGTKLTTSTLPVPSDASADGTLYRARFVTSSGDTLTSAAARLTVIGGDAEVAPYVTVQPTGVTLTPEDRTAEVSATVRGAPAPEVTWQARTGSTGAWTDLPAGSSTLTPLGSNLYRAVLTVDNDDPALRDQVLDGTQLRALVHNDLGDAETNVVTLTNQIPEIGIVGGPAVIGHTVTVSARNIPGGQMHLVNEHGQFVTIAGDGSNSAWRKLPQQQLEREIRYVVGDGSPAVFRPGRAWLELLNGSNVVVATSAELDLIRDETETVPVIATQPEWGAYAGDGATISTSVTVGGETPFRVYWQSDSRGDGNWINTSAAAARTEGRSSTLTADPSYNPTSMRFRAVVASSAGLVVSTAVGAVPYTATTVERPLPAEVLAGVGVPTTLEAAATGSPRATASWSSSADGVTWTPVPADRVTTTTAFVSQSVGWRTTTAVALDAPARSDSGRYRVTFTGRGSVTSTTTLTVSDADVPVVVTTQPLSQAIEAGERVTFTAAATGVPTPTVQ